MKLEMRKKNWKINKFVVIKQHILKQPMSHRKKITSESRKQLEVNENKNTTFGMLQT